MTLLHAARVSDGERVRFGHAVRYAKYGARVVAWGACDAAMAWRLRECLDAMAAQGHQRVDLDVGEMHFVEFTAVAILSGALTRAAREGIEVAVDPPDCASEQILRKAHFRPRTTESACVSAPEEP